MSKHLAVFIVTVSLLRSTIGAAPPTQAAAGSADQVQVTEAIRSFFAAATADDLDKLHAVTAPDFYAFDAGGRFTRDGLMDLIKAAHVAGKVYLWSVTEPDVHISGDMAWIAYVNRGSVKDGSGTKEVTWLESAVLHKDNGMWRIHFFHSTRVREKN